MLSPSRNHAAHLAIIALKELPKHPCLALEEHMEWLLVRFQIVHNALQEISVLQLLIPLRYALLDTIALKGRNTPHNSHALLERH